MRLTVIGCGDAFGSGGRLQSAYLIEAAGRTVLLDCVRTMLTLLNSDMLAFAPGIRSEGLLIAEDGLKIDV